MATLRTSSSGDVRCNALLVKVGDQGLEFKGRSRGCITAQGVDGKIKRRVNVAAPSTGETLNRLSPVIMTRQISCLTTCAG